MSQRRPGFSFLALFFYSGNAMMEALIFSFIKNKNMRYAALILGLSIVVFLSSPVSAQIDTQGSGTITSTDSYCTGRSAGASCVRPSGSGDCRNMSGVLTCVSNVNAGTGSGTGTGTQGTGATTSSDAYCSGKNVGAPCVRPSGSGDCRDMSGVLTCVASVYGSSGSSGTGSSAFGSSGYSMVNCPNGVIRSGVCFPMVTGLSDMPLILLIMRVMNWLLAIFGMIAIIAFVISGLQYLLSAGDEDAAETAKRNMKYSIIGVVVGLSGWIIVNAIDNALNGWSFWYF